MAFKISPVHKSSFQNISMMNQDTQERVEETVFSVNEDTGEIVEEKQMTTVASSIQKPNQPQKETKFIGLVMRKKSSVSFM